LLIIGEKLNSAIARVREAIRDKDRAYIQDLARKQVEAGAGLLDVNTAMEDEVEDMQWLVETVQEAVDVPLCIDSTNPAAIKRALMTHKGRAMVNSITLEKNRIDGILPLVLAYNCPVVALTSDERGIPKTVADRLRITEQLIELLRKNNYDLDNLYIDPLVLPLAVNSGNAAIFFQSLEEIKRSFPVKTISGLSNVSHSLPKRRLVNRFFLTTCMSRGMDAAILDPLDKKMMNAVLTADLLLGNDRLARRYLQAYREGVLED
jgi:cobalamin-dependent methionine synthase I